MSAQRMSLTSAGYHFLQDYIHRESGIALGDDKQYLVESRLSQVAAEEGLDSLDALCLKLRTPLGAGLRSRVVEAMTTHETLFFRDYPVFEALRTHIFAAAGLGTSSARPFRIWSAACSSGQEPYSLAMMAAAAGHAASDFQILGTDLSEQILQRARSGKYLQIEVNRGLPAPMLVKHFQRTGADWQIKDTLKQYVSFQQLDLRKITGGIGPFHVILCRNVLIYFELATRQEIVANLRRLLHPGGVLLFGASESSYLLDSVLERRNAGSVIFYQKQLST